MPPISPRCVSVWEKKNGEVKCFREGGTVFAFSWNQGARRWEKIGEVVSEAVQQKKQYEGDQVFAKGEYDFVFDVDMGPAHGMRRLPYNRGQNPMVVAESFCAREQINKSNTDQIRQFIIQNAGEDATSGGAALATAEKPPDPAASVFPLSVPFTFKDGKFDPLRTKILEFNEQVPQELKLDATDILHLDNAINKLKAGGKLADFRGVEKEVIHVKLGAWPVDKLFPVVDLWRLYLTHPQSCDYYKGSDRGAPFLTAMNSHLTADVNGPLALCSARYLANLFLYQTNKYAAFDRHVPLLKVVDKALTTSTNKNVKLACASLLVNFSIVMHEASFPPKQFDVVAAAEIARQALGFLVTGSADDTDAKARAVLAIGTLLARDRANGRVVVQMCVEAGFLSKLGSMEGKIGGPSVVAEFGRLLS